MMGVVIFVSCFTYLDLDLVFLLLLTPSPIRVTPTFLIESFGVNVGMYIVAAAHFHIY